MVLTIFSYKSSFQTFIASYKIYLKILILKLLSPLSLGIRLKKILTFLFTLDLPLKIYLYLFWLFEEKNYYILLTPLLLIQLLNVVFFFFFHIGSQQQLPLVLRSLPSIESFFEIFTLHEELPRHRFAFIQKRRRIKEQN